jgi:Fe-S cluster assembly scaffold protein SufB
MHAVSPRGEVAYVLDLLPGTSCTFIVHVEALAAETVDIAVRANVGEEASLDVVVIARGGGNVRIVRQVTVGEAGSFHGIFAGEFAGEAACTVDDDVRVIGARAVSTLRVRSVLREHASIAACGRMVLERTARQSTAHASMDHLLLGKHVRAQSIPELTAHTDDVTCGHRASTSRPRAEEIFYLASRGFSPEQSDELLASAFLCPVREAYV